MDFVEIPLPAFSLIIMLLIQGLKTLAPWLTATFPVLIPILPTILSILAFVLGLLPENVELIGALGIGAGSNLLFSAGNAGAKTWRRRFNNMVKRGRL